jgi:pimeloyl-ACP methyl ester carboxylesterase
MRDPIVLLPPMFCDARAYAQLTTALSPAHTLVQAPITGGDRIEEIASGLLDTLPRRCVLVGQGLGAIVAMELARRAGDRVSGLVLASTTALAETPQGAAHAEPLIIKLKSDQMEAAVDGVWPTGAFAPGPSRGAVIEGVRKMARNLGAQACISQIRANQRRRDYQGVLRQCKAPALVLCGDQEGAHVPRHHQLLADLIPGAQAHVIEGAGALPSLEQPAAFRAAITAWLTPR